MARGKRVASPGDEEDKKLVPINGTELAPNQQPIVNAQVIQILYQKDKSQDLENLLKMDLEYNEKRLAILREHSLQHPDKIEQRRTRSHRRIQAYILLFISMPLLCAMYWAPLAISFTFGIIVLLIVIGAILNSRDRDSDLDALTSLMTEILRRMK